MRWYRKTDEYCLPFETRELVAIENADDDLLKLQVSCVLEDRLQELSMGSNVLVRHEVLSACHSTLERIFEHQGIQMARYAVSGQEDDELFTNASGMLSTVIDEGFDYHVEKSEIRRLALLVLRGTFYSASTAERSYLEKMSKTYVLLLLLKNEPRIVEYFQQMPATLRLYVGTDILVRALAEHYLRPDDRTTENLLLILKAAGAELILTQKAVEEVSTHLRRQIFEFENFYSHVEGSITYEAVEYIDRLLIRAYFYARLAPVPGISPPLNWGSYIAQFATYASVKSDRGDADVGAYLSRKFGLTYEPVEVMLKGIDEAELDELTTEMVKVRSENNPGRSGRDVLAYNDAIQVLRIYARRVETGEESPANPFGFQTWWLTQDSKVRRASVGTVNRHGNKLFMMRPEFLLNYISFAPDLQAVRDSFRTIFPSVLGVRLTNRLHSREFDKVLREAAEIASYDEARAGALVTQFTNALKGDREKIYENEWLLADGSGDLRTD